MIHRTATDCIAATAVLAVANVPAATSILTEADWNRLLGPLGGFVLSILMLLYFVARDKSQATAKVKSDMDTDAANERRHKEIIDLQKENAQKLIALTVASIRSDHLVSRSLDKLASQINSRPCQCKTYLPKPEQQP